MADSQDGRTLGQYRLIERIGVGGMGVVFRAVHQRLGRQAAVKILPETLASDPNFLRRFEREAANAAALQHNHILAVWDYGEEGGVPYLVMPYITGGTLRQRLAAGPLRPQEALGYLRQVADALDYAHSQGIVHRDVKPANLLLDGRGQLYLADFGIAKALEGAEGLTRTGMGVGTPEYMAPEQARGQADHRADLYALGIILYQMLTGQVPFSGNSTVEVLMKHLQDQPSLTPLRTVQPTLPQGVEQVVQKALSKNPNDRFQSGKAMVDALAGALGSETARGTATAMPASPPPPRPDQLTEYNPTVQYGHAPSAAPSVPVVPPALPPTPTPQPLAPLYAQPQYQTPMPAPAPVSAWGGGNTGGNTGTATGGGSTNRILIIALASAAVVLLLCVTGIGAFALFRDTATPTPVPTANLAATGTAAAVVAFNTRATQTANAPTPVPSPTPTTTPTRPPTATAAPSPSPTATATPQPTATATTPPVVSRTPRGALPAAGWKTFTGHANAPFAIYYPPDWTIDTQSAADGLIYLRPPGAGSTWMLIATTGVPETNGNIDVLRDQYYNNTLGECTAKAIDRTNYTEYSGITFAGLGATCETTSGLTYARIGLGLNSQVPWRYRLNAPYGEYSDTLDNFFQPMLNSLNIYQNP